MTTKAVAATPSVPSGIEGLDDILGGGYPEGKATVIRGASGTGKTILSLKFACHAGENEPAVLVTFDEHPQSLMAQMEVLGLSRCGVSLIDLRPHPDTRVQGDNFELGGLLARVEQELEKTGARRLVFDSFDTLILALGGQDRIRTELQRVFNWVRERGVTLIATHATESTSRVGTGIEDYASDCVIHLTQQLHHRLMTRMLRIVKLRGRRHGTSEYPFSIGDEGIMVMPVSETRLNAPASREHLSTGIEELDLMLGGKGIFRGSITMISGQSGTGKSSFANLMADAACRRGERVHYLTFEESPDEVLRNMDSIGLTLHRHMEEGLLHIDALRSVEHGLEEHLMRVMHMVKTERPDVLVIDPISALTDMGETFSAKSVMVRLCSFLKSHGVTTVISELLPDDAHDVSSMNISSMIDSWIRVRLVERDNRFQRRVHVRKSRGQAVDQDVKGFRITNQGIVIERI